MQATDTQQNRTIATSRERGNFSILLFAALMCLALLLPLQTLGQNFVYVTNRTATGNTVAGFAVDGGGVLTAVPGSPFAAGVAGAATSCAAIDRITVSPATNLMFVSNSGDLSINVYRIDATTGALTGISGSPFASGLTLDSCNGISLAATPDGKFLMASSNGTIKTFNVNGTTGALTSTVAPTTGLPVPMGSLKISGNGAFLASANQNSVSMFAISAVDGSLIPTTASPFAKTGAGLLSGLAFNCDGTFLYGGEGNQATSITDAWSVALNGALTPVLGSPFGATGNDSNVVFLSPDNTLFFQSNQGSNDLNSFTVNPDGTITSIGIFTGTTTPPAGLASDNSGLFLYAADSTAGVAVFNMVPGAVPTLVAANPVTGAGQIQGVAAYPPRSCAHADFAVTQTATPNPVTAGNNITYTITVTNNGQSTASVAINDLLPRADMTFVSCTPSGNGVCDKGVGLNRTITFASLASGQSGTATIVGKTVATLLNQDTIINTAASSNASVVDPNPADNAATTTVTVSAPPSATNIGVNTASAPYFGSTTLNATLHRTAPGALIAGRTLAFTVDGVAIGTGITNTTGVALVVVNVGTVNGGLAAGAHQIGVSFTQDAQFASSTSTAVLTVTKAVLTVTAQNATRLFGDANPTFTFVISAFLNNETVAVVTGAPNCTSSAGPATSVGSVTITCSIGTLAAANYTFSFVSASLSITPAPLVLTGTNVSRLYGDPNPIITGTIVGLKNGNTGTATFSTTALITSPVGSYPINGVFTPAGGTSASNYTITSSGNVTVTPAPLNVTASNVTRAYGDPNPSFAGAITGLKNGDAITGVFGVTADATSPVGTYPITATLTDPGNKLSNYTVVNTGTLTITPAPLTVVANSATRLYGDANPAFTGSVTGQKNGDAISATFSTTATPASNVGTYPIVATLVDPGNKAGNYTFTPASGTLTVTQAPLAVTAADATRVYGDANPVFTGTIVGLKNADPITATYATTAVLASNVGTFPITPTLVDPNGKLPNYAVLSTNGNLTVTPAPLSVTATSATRIYGDANPAFTGTISGLKNADAITATFATTATAASNVGTFTIVPTLVDAAPPKLGNYTVTSNNGTLTISPATLTVAGTNATRVYGDPNPVFAGTLTGLKNADAITATFTSTATPASPVGTLPITGTLNDPAGKLPNYTVVSNAGVLTITAAPLTVAAADATRVYGDPNPAFTGTITGIKNGDAITASFTSVATPLTNVGTVAITSTLADPTAKLGNYAVTSTNGTLTITQAPLTVTAGNATRVYGDTNPPFSGTITGLKNGDNITATVSGAGASLTSPVGTYPLVPALVDPTGRLGNYSTTITNGTLTVTPAPLSVNAANASRAYGDPNPSFTGTIIGIKNADNITATFVTTATPASNIGTFNIVPTLVDPTTKLGNYTVTSTNGTLTVAPALLTIAATSTTRLYGDPNPSFTGTITGIKNADAITATFASAATAASSVGTATIVPTLLDPTAKLGNYTVTSQNGTLTIAPAALTVTGGTATRLYGDPNPALTGTITGIKNADNITATFASPAVATTGVGPAAIVPTLVDPAGKLGNYAVTSVNGVLTINPAPLSVTAGNATRIYGDPNPAFSGTITGLKNGDNITATVSGAGAALTSPVGTYPLVAALVDPTGKLPNYSVTTTDGVLTVTPAPLTIAASNASRAYGDANPVFSATLTGLKNGDAITATATSAATLTSPVGTISIVPTAVDSAPGKLSNYTVTLNNGTLTITPAPLTIAAANATRLYGDANPAFTATLTGLKNADAITATASSTATPASAVGSFNIIPAAVDAAPSKLGNYTVTLTSGTLTVAPAPLSISANPASRLYGDPNPVFTGTVTGLKNADNITATFTSAATAATGVGSTAIVPTPVDPTAKLGNYAVTFNNGVLTINPAPLTVTAGSVSRLYGDPNPAFVGTVTGLKNGDNITAVVGGTGADPASPVGTFVLVPALVDPTNKAANYTVTLNNGTLTITPAPLNIAANAATRLYGDPNPAFIPTFTGIKNADAITASFTTTAIPASNVGTFTIVPAAVDAPTPKLSNYTVTLTNGTLTIAPAPLAIAAANASRLYGDANPPFTATLTGLKNGDAITATGSSTATPASPVGNAVIVPAAVDAPTPKLGNYTVTLTNGTLTIAPAPLTISANPASRLYGNLNPAFTGTITGVKNADNITASFSTPATAATGVGPAAIIPAAVDPTAKLGNYTVVLNNGVLTITPAPLTVSAGSVSRLYGDPNPAFVGSVIGLKNGDNITAIVGGVGADPTSPVGTFVLVPQLVDPTNKGANYTVTLNNGTLTITPAPLNIAANAATRLYGDPNPAFSPTLTGLKNADAITASFTTTATVASNVGTFTIVPAAVDAPTPKLSNYTVTLTNGLLTVNPAPLSITANNATRLYGDANPAFTATPIGLKNGDAITATASSTATPASAVGNFAIVPAAIDAPTPKLGNYSVTLTNGTLAITQAPLTIAANAASRLYGDANPAFTGSITGIKNLDNITATFSTAAGLTTGVGVASIVPAAVDPTAKLGNYSLVLTNGTLTINPAPLTVSAGSVSRLYGDPNPAFVGSVVGLKNGDNISAIVGGVGADPTSPVGTFVLVPQLVDPTNKAANYTVTLNNGTLTITAAPLLITANNATRLYGDPNPAFSPTFTGIRNADAISASFTTAATAASNVGTFSIIPAAVDSVPAKLSNYTVTLTNGTLTVTPAPLAIDAANATRIYGDANPAFTATPVGLKNGDAITATASSTATPASPAGSAVITPVAVDAVPSKLGNYTLTLNSGTLTISKAPLAIAATPANRVYGDPNPAFTGTVSGIKNADPITATFRTTAGLTTPVGVATIVPTAVDPAAKLGNYTLALTNANLTITPAPLTVTAGNVTRLYGDPNPPFNGTILGLKNGDNITAIVSGAGAAPVSPVGSYVLVPSLVDSVPSTLGNYTPTFTNGTLTITAAPLTITGNNATRAYGDPNPAFTATFAGLKNADNITASFTSAVQTAGVGSYPIVVTPVDPGAKLTNYSVSVTNGTLTVSPAALSVVATNATRLYGDPNPVFTGTLTGVKNADAITASFTSAAVATSPVGPVVILANLTASAATLANYTVTSQNGTLTIAPAPLTVTGSNDSRLYGDPNPVFSGTISGVKNLDNIAASFGSTATVTSPVGTYPIAGTLVDPTNKLPNYTVINNNGTLTVTPAPLAVTATNASRLYGDPNPAFTGTVTGLRNADAITASFTSVGPASAVGVFPITPVLADPTNKLGNYAVTANNGVLTIGPASLSVSAANASRPYGAANPVFTGSITGIKNADNITATFNTTANTASGVGTYVIVPVLVDPTAKLGNYAVTSSNAVLTVTQSKPAVVLNVAAAVPTSQLTAQVQNTGPALPTGTVQFFDGAASLGAPVAIAVQGGVATASLQIGLANGAHSITANYSGDATYIASTSTPVPVNVGSTPTFGLSGTGGNTTATVAAGKDAVYNLSLANQGFAGNISFACSGAPAGTTCTVNPNPLTVSAASSSAPITVTISNTQNARLKPIGSKPFGSKMPMFVFAGVLVGLFSGMSKKRRKLVLVFMAAFMIAGMVACGGGSLNVSNGGGRGPTNATVSVVGTSGSQTATINLSLTITH